jgi:non-ribosomal peptide synthase protein (TIGR01720 family)
LPAPQDLAGEREQQYLAPRTPVEELLVEIWTVVLGVEQIGVLDNFFHVGGDSILSIQVIAQAAQHGLRIIPRQIFQYPTIAELATVADATKVIESEQGLVTGDVPLTPVQQWFFEQRLDEPQHWNQAVLFEVREALDLPLIKETLEYLAEHHDALRLRFTRSDQDWQQATTGIEQTSLAFSYVSSSELPDEGAFQAIASELQASLNLAQGPLARVAYFEGTEEKPARLLMVFHHLIIDGVSWRILLDDMQTAYRQLSKGKKIRLSAKTTSYQRWAESLAELAQTTKFQEEQAYWWTSPTIPAAQLPFCYSGGVNTVASARTIDRALSAQETQALLQTVPAAYNTNVNDLLLTSLALAFRHWTDETSLLVDLEGHGRENTLVEDVDLSRTIGWFTTIYPLTLSLEDMAIPGEQLQSIKEQLRKIPDHGIGYGMLRYLSRNAEITERLGKLSEAEVIFNYLGQFDQILSEAMPLHPSSDSSGAAQSPGDKRRHLLEVTGNVFGGQLRLIWTYSVNVHSQAVIESLADDFMHELRGLIAHCQSPEAGAYTPSDFPLANLDETALAEFLERVEF